MKTPAPLFLMTLLLSTGAYAQSTAQKNSVDSVDRVDRVDKVSKVIVYRDSALVERSRFFACDGAKPSTFKLVSGAADTTSFSARAWGATVVGVNWTRISARAGGQPEEPLLVAQERALDREKAAAESQVRRASDAAESVTAYLELTRQTVETHMALGKAPLATWSAALDTLLKTGIAAERRGADARSNLTRVEERQADLRVRREQVTKNSGRTAYDVEVGLSCRRGDKVHVVLSYQVGGVSWSPRYEAHARTQEGIIAFSTVAELTQSSGEHWEDVSLVLSTGVANQDVSAPTLRPLVVGAHPDATSPTLVPRAEKIPERPRAGAISATTSDKKGGTQIETLAVGNNVELMVPGSVTVVGDGTPVQVPVATAHLPATFALRAVPKRLSSVFHVADVVNQTPLPLLPSTVSAFRDGGFVGLQDLPEIPAGGSFTLGLGVEARIRVRQVVIEESERTEGLFRRRRRHGFAYRFYLQSFLATEQNIQIVDQIPVSELEEVKVTLEGQTSPMYELDERDGLVTFSIKLAPAETRHVDLAFSVHVPRAYW